MRIDDDIDDDDVVIGQVMLDIADAEALDFEHRRVLAAIRHKLIGSDEPLVIHARYRVIRRLGGGGMGEVYLCEDEQLHRRVAVKFVRGEGNSHDQVRLRREAQMLAGLSHPNLVVAFDVGEHEDRTFLAMEYIEGETLAQWLAQVRPRHEVLARFIAAGRGLAAAHRAGIVHRDFKPANVLLGEHGTVKVADFGLALAEGGAELDQEARLSTAEGSFDSRLSMVGAAGTARYMSLEQLAGLSVDSRSDQFGFCLALYEALWGQPPFPDTNVRTRREALSRGEPNVPARQYGLWRVIRRGLARDRTERWPSMDALLSALERAPKRRLWIARSFAALVAGLAVGLVVIVTRNAATAPPSLICEDVEQELIGVWDENVRRELEEHFRKLDAKHLTDSSKRVLAGLEDWADGWIAESEQVCRGLASPTRDWTKLIAHDACLDRRREHVESIVDKLANGTSDDVADAVITVQDVREEPSCADEAAVAVPIAEIRQDLAWARELRRTGEFGQAKDVAQAANDAALATGYGPLEAEARAELAMIEEVTGPPLDSVKRYEEAIDLAEIHRLDELLARLWIERAELSLGNLDVERGRWELHRAEVAGVASNLTKSDNTWWSARLAFAHGRLAELDDNRYEARQNYFDAVEITRAVAGEDLPDYLSALARVTDSKDEKVALYREAVALDEERWGPRHPEMVLPMFELGVALRETGRGGERELEMVGEIGMDAARIDKLPKAHLLRSRQALRHGDLNAAEAHARVMASIQEKVLPERHPDRGEPEQLLATIESVRGNHQSALDHARAALAWFELAGHDDPGAWSMRFLIVDQLLALDRLDEAEQPLQSMLADKPSDAGLLKTIHLQFAELAVRRNLLEDADLQLRTVVELDPDENSFVYEFLRALVDLRRGRLEREQVERVQSAPQPFTPDQLSAWFEQLALTRGERRRLLLP